MLKVLTESEITNLIKEANICLKAGHTKVALLRIGNMLYFQGTFPPKPGSHRARPYQQKIASRLPVSRAGIKRARSEATLLGAKLVTGQFDWSDYSNRTKRGQKTVGQWVDDFEKCYRTQNTIKDSTWQDGWLQYFNVLALEQPLTPELLVEACLSKPKNTAARKLICARLQALADFAGIGVDLRKYQGRYGRASQKPRELPSDELIADWCGGDRIRSPEWRRVAGLMAAFGLRPHEVFLGRLLDTGEYQVLDGKTGERTVKPFYPEWVDQWELWGDLPNIDAHKAYARGQLGNFIRGHLRRTHKMPFVPYDLRHAYAIRVHVLFGLPETVGARLMGHGPDVHMRTYQRWLGEAAAAAAVDRALSQKDRPKPP